MLRPVKIGNYFHLLQKKISSALEALDEKGRFRKDKWKTASSFLRGGGETRVLEGGALIEKGGVNFSFVHGPLPPDLAKTLKLPKQGRGRRTFTATGISVVLHPRSPMIPVIHMNLRFFEIRGGGSRPVHSSWFGGGMDISPCYVDEEEVRFFHRSLKKVCDRFDPLCYPAFKREADDYFFLPHRNETRGAGGIFFDRLGSAKNFPLAKRWEFVKEIGNCFVPVYSAMVKKKKNTPYGEAEKRWQALRRSRYAEFNLLYDRGTRFGLLSGGRTESIFMSLPPSARWDYDVVPAEGSKEKKTLQWLRRGIDWVAQR